MGLLIVAYFLLFQRKRVRTRQEAISAATMMIVLVGAVLLASRLVLQTVLPNLGFRGLLDLFVLHFLASLVLPWRPRESVLPFALLLLIWAVTFLVPHATDWLILDRVVVAIASPVILVPGILISAWRWRRREEDAERLRLGEQVRNIGGELSRRASCTTRCSQGRSISDTSPSTTTIDRLRRSGAITCTSTCARERGGFALTVLDVAGHGLAAALTVNRLFGELERILAEDSDAEPAQIMELLNRYINLTMAAHSMYATGLCIALDPATGETTWVNAGHPPALVRKADGRVLDLATTTILLGAVTYAEFESEQQSTKLDPGDVIITYTDGAFEARNAAGVRFGLPAIRKTAQFSPPPRDWSKFITSAVSQHHGGHAEDDVLVASLQLRSLRLGELYAEEPATRQQTPPKEQAVPAVPRTE